MSRLKLIIFSNLEYCAPCRSMQPIIEELEQEYSDRVDFVHYDTDEALDEVEDYGIRSVPTYIFERDGNEMHRTTGQKTKVSLQIMIDKKLNNI